MRKANEAADLLPNFLEATSDEAMLKANGNRNKGLFTTESDASFAHKMQHCVDAAVPALVQLTEAAHEKPKANGKAVTDTVLTAKSTGSHIAESSNLKTATGLADQAMPPSANDAGTDRRASSGAEPVQLDNKQQPRAILAADTAGSAQQADSKTTSPIAVTASGNQPAQPGIGRAVPTNDKVPATGQTGANATNGASAQENTSPELTGKPSRAAESVANASNHVAGTLNTQGKSNARGKSRAAPQGKTENSVPSAKALTTVDMARQSRSAQPARSVAAKVTNTKRPGTALNNVKQTAQSSHKKISASHNAEAPVMLAASADRLAESRAGQILSPLLQRGGSAPAGAAIPTVGGGPVAGSGAMKSADSAFEMSPIETPPDQTEFKTQLSERVAVAIRQGIESARIQLNPRDLGPVQIDLSLDGQQAFVSFSAAHADTREAIRQSLDELRANLDDQGLELAGADVSDTDRDEPSEQPAYTDEFAQERAHAETADQKPQKESLPPRANGQNSETGAIDLFV